LAFQAAKHLRPRFNLAKGSLKKGCSVRLNVVETAVALNICEKVGSLKPWQSLKPMERRRLADIVANQQSDI